MSEELSPQPAASFPAPRDSPLEYPGKRPLHSFVLASETVFPVMDTGNWVVTEHTGQKLDLDAFLMQRNAATLDERFAVIGYGSNAVPGQLVSKFGNDAVVPVLMGTLANCDIVYNLISNSGYAFAELLVDRGQTECPVGITFLDDRQIGEMISSEQNYRLAFAPSTFVFPNDAKLHTDKGRQLYVFAGFQRIWIPNGRTSPVSIAELSSREDAESQEVVLSRVLDEFADRLPEGIDTPSRLVQRLQQEAEAEDGPGKVKFILQEAVEKSERSLPCLIDSVDLADTKKVTKFLDWEVDGTKDLHRTSVPFDFVVVLNTERAKKLGLKQSWGFSRYVAIERTTESGNNEGERDDKKALRVYARLVVDSSIHWGTVGLDQTLRNALGIPFSIKSKRASELQCQLGFFPVRVGIRERWKAFLTRLLGRRYLYCRVAKPHPPDIEKDICRISKDSLALMGTQEGNRIVLVSCTEQRDHYTLKNYSIKAFDLNETMTAQRTIEEDEAWDARYVAASKLLNVEPDIGRIVLDKHFRSVLGVQPGDPIKMRREFPDLFKQQLLDVGIALGVSVVALYGLLDPFFADPIGKLSITMVGSTVISFGVIILRLRGRVV
jgi:hypothetical protein